MDALAGVKRERSDGKPKALGGKSAPNPLKRKALK
jgi:hypothetical protein